MLSTSREASATSNDFFFGWNLLFRTIDRDINKKSDVLIALLHFVLIKHFQLRCIGVGDDKTIFDEDYSTGSELLPEGWNDDDKKYASRYLYNSQLYLLLGYKSEGCLIINLLNVQTNEVSNIALNPEDLVKQMKGPLNTVIPDVSQLVARYRKELGDPVITATTQEESTQTNVNNQQTSINKENEQSDIANDRLRTGERRYSPYWQFDPIDPIISTTANLVPIRRIGSDNIFPFPLHPEYRGFRQPRFDPYGLPDVYNFY